MQVDQQSLAQKISRAANKLEKEDRRSNASQKGGKRAMADDDDDDDDGSDGGGSKGKPRNTFADSDSDDDDDEDEDFMGDQNFDMSTGVCVGVGAVGALCGALLAVGGYHLFGLATMFAGSCMICPALINHSKKMERTTRRMEDRYNELKDKVNSKASTGYRSPFGTPS